MCSVDIFLGLLALLFPPVAVWIKCGLCSADSLINILLCCLGFIPGLLHAWYIIAKYPERNYEYEVLPQHVEGGQSGRSDRATYVFVQPQPQGPPKPYNHHAQPQQSKQQQQSYGTVNAASAGSSSAPQQQGNDAAPPSYNEAVGDHKIQTRD